MSASAKFTLGYALIVGVGDDLPVTVKDANGIYDLLVDSDRCAYPAKQVRLLTGPDATKANILAGIEWLASLTDRQPEATVVIYFSGHGGEISGYHLVPFGYDPTNIKDTAISGDELSKQLSRVRCQKLLVLLDCCHAAAMYSIKSPSFRPSPLPPELDQILTKGSGRVVIASSRRDELSYTGEPYSVFTQALREGLAGYGAAEPDGYAYIADVALYVGRVVPERTSARQHPILKLSGADNFAIAFYGGGEKQPKSLLGVKPQLIPLNLAAEYRSILQTHQRNLIRLEERIAMFLDQAAVPLDLERARDQKLEQIAQYERLAFEKTNGVGKSFASEPEQNSALSTILDRIDALEATLGTQFDDLKRGQAAIYNRISPDSQYLLEQILSEAREQHFGKNIMQRVVDETHQALKSMLHNELVMRDADLLRSLTTIQESLDSNIGFEEHFELSLPLIPFLIEYKINLGAGIDLSAVWNDLVQFLRSK